jgi:hypothetical protein
MNWHVVWFDLDRDQPPGHEPQLTFFLQVARIYGSLNHPVGFALFDKWYVEKKIYAFFFSPVASVNCKSLIDPHRNEVWDKPIPDDASCKVGDDNVRWQR